MHPPGKLSNYDLIEGLFLRSGNVPLSIRAISLRTGLSVKTIRQTLTKRHPERFHMVSLPNTDFRLWKLVK